MLTTEFPRTYSKLWRHFISCLCLYLRLTNSYSSILDKFPIWRTFFFVWLFCFEGIKHEIWVIHMYETPVSLRDLTQTFNWGSRSHFIGNRIAKAYFGNRKFTGHNYQRDVQTCRTFPILISFAEWPKAFKNSGQGLYLKYILCAYQAFTLI